MQIIKLNTAAINAIESIALADAQCERATLAALPALIKAFEGQDREAIKATVQVNYAHAVGVELKQQGTGRIVWPKEDPRAQSAKRACNRLIERILAGDSQHSDSDREEIEIPAELLAAAAKLAKLAKNYEAGRKLASKALAMAFAK